MSLGGWMELVPKYHPEFNFIDMYWGYVKRRVGNECDCNWQTLIEHTPEALYSVLLIFMRREYTKCCRYIEIYRVLLTPAQVEFAYKKYNSHHSIPEYF